MNFEPEGLGATIFQERYARHEGETWEQACRRVAEHVAGAEDNGKYEKYQERFLKELVSNRFMPGGRIWYGAGRPKAQLMNCYTVGPENMDSREGWGKTISDVIVISGLGGGVGINLSPVRPRGTEIKGTGGKATGAVSLMQMIDRVGDVLVSGGGRRLALMLCLDVTHPDLEEFLNVKLDLDQLNNANISICLDMPTEEFIEKVRNGDEIEFEFGGRSTGETINAKTLWDRLVDNAWNSGEPGVLNTWLMNQQNNIHYYKEISTTNPCFPASERILIEDGYYTFGYLHDLDTPNNVLADNRVSYQDDGAPESIEKWKIDSSKQGVSSYEASNVYLTRHSSQIVCVETDIGYKLRCTPDHKIATPYGMKEAQDLIPGEELLLSLPKPSGSVLGQTPFSREEKTSFLIGMITGDGTFASGQKTLKSYIDCWGDDSERMIDLCEQIIDDLWSSEYESGVPEMSPHNSWQTRTLSSSYRLVVEDRNKIRLASTWLTNYLSQYGFSKETKHIVPEFILQNARTDIAKFYLAALFYCDGSIQGKNGDSVSIRLAQSNKKFLQDTQLLLQANGIMSTLSLRRPSGYRSFSDGKGGHKQYFCRAQYELIIGKDRMVFAETIGFAGHPEKETKLNNMVENQSINVNWRKAPKVISVTEDGIEDVYCLSQNETRSIIVNGIAVARCGEQPLESYGSCNLGALVLPRFIQDGGMNWDQLDETVRLGVRFLDDIIDVNYWPLAEIKENCEKVRRVGVGVMGLHTMLLELGMKYSSSEAHEFIDKLFAFIKNTAYDTSINLAIEKGPFPVYDPRFLQSGFIKTLKRGIRNKIKEYGIRNSHLITVAPTGTTGIVSDVSTGIEPYVAPVYWRHYKSVDDKMYDIMNKELVVRPEWENYGELCEGAADLSPRDHFEVQKIVQRHIDSAVSKTINLPSDFTSEQLSEIWLEYLPYCKGTTLYRWGSREMEPFEPIPLDQIQETIENHESQDWGSDAEALVGCVNGVCEIDDKQFEEALIQ